MTYEREEREGESMSLAVMPCRERREKRGEKRTARDIALSGH